MANTFSPVSDGPHGNGFDSITPNYPDANPKASSVAWGAIIAGATAAMVVTLVMTVLGSSLGLAVSSPWENEGASATGIAAGAIVWLMLTQWSSSALGGYLSGRLRTRWNIHNDEVFFRDTAHGFLTWSLATLVTVFLVSSAATSAINAGVQAAAKMEGGMMAGAMAHHGPRSGANGMDPMSMDYYIDTLIRSDAAGAPASERDSRGEIARITANAAKEGAMSAEDKAYLSRLVASRAGLPEDEAGRRVDNLLAQMEAAKVKAKDAADKARTNAATTAALLVLSMLLGAFVAAVAAAIGGRQRDY